jgi:hypothetical protein
MKYIIARVVSRGAFLKKTFLFSFSALLLSVHLVSAQSLAYFENIFDELGSVLGVAIPVLVALALALFIWGMVVFIFSAGDDSARKTGQKHMIWGLVALFVIVSVWGLVQLLQVIFGADGDIGGIEAPELP